MRTIMLHALLAGRGRGLGFKSSLEPNKKLFFSSQSDAIIFGRALNSLLFPHRLSVIISSFALLNQKAAMNNGQIFSSQSEASLYFASEVF